ncbi:MULTISPECIES: hypothetical protein [unclassified Mesorhizobium]|uniref:hypothetical protein n=1 Tax=unclassified Mesorhizobium TaxID=325217 RepID=UPI00167A3D95|nr:MULTISPECIES: hypothetical protein [unclassified Mesorhizobium]
MTEEQIKLMCQRAVLAFVNHFERKPTKAEQAALVSCLTRIALEPNAPTTELH